MLRAMAAAALGGYTLCGINNTRRGDGLLNDIRRAECQLLVTDAEHRPLLDGLDLAGVRVLDTSTDEWADLVAGAGPLTPHREVEAMDTFMMIFTSGTSGDPKAVQVNHLMVLFSGLNLQGRFELGADDVCYVAMPLFHSNAVVAGWSPAVCGGATIVPAKFSASRFLADVREYGVTYMNYVGKPLAYVLATPELPDDADNTLRVAFGNEASDRDIDEFSRRFGCDVWDGFGSTELAVIITREPGTPKGSIGKGFDGVAIYNSETVTECAVAVFDENGALTNADEADRRAGQHPGRRLLQRLLQRPGRQRRADAARHVLVRRPRLPRRRRLDLPRRAHRRLDARRRREPRRRPDRADPPAAARGQPGRGVRRARTRTSATR